MSACPAPAPEPASMEQLLKENAQIREALAFANKNLDAKLREIAELRKHVDAEGLLRGWRSK
jgi:hypothetical protein